MEAVDLSRIDRRLADKIEAEVDQIKAEIVRNGHCDVRLEGRTFRVYSDRPHLFVSKAGL
jgi:hypothetical protein